jgi:phosphate transport system protein
LLNPLIWTIVVEKFESKTVDMPFLKSLDTELKEMWELVQSQHQKSLTALQGFDKDLAREIVLIEERVNSCEQFIESDCEHYFAVRSSKNEKVSFVMFALKTTRHLEITGDVASKIAHAILRTTSPYPTELIAKTNLIETFKRSNKIIELAMQAFAENDKLLAQVALNRIAVCQEMVLDCKDFLTDYIKSHPHLINQALFLFSILESIKRTLEVIQNISLGIIKFNEKTAIVT